MRLVIAIVLMLGLVAISLPALAEDGQNVPDQLGDIFSGKGNTYGGVEIIKDDIIKLFGVPLGAKIWADCMLGEIDDGVRRDIRGGIRLRIKL